MENRAPRPNRLLRILGITFGLAVTIGGTVGVGILRAPGPVAAQLGAGGPGLILCVWMLGGLYVLVSALSVAELATALPQAGGFYVYTRRAFGNAAGFTAGWVDWLTQCAAVAYLGISMAEFAAALWPALAGRTTAFAVLLIGAITGLQWRGTRVSGRTQEIAGAVQACAFVAFIAACFVLGDSPPAVAARAQGSPAPWMSAALALRLVIATFDGWYSAIFFTEEVRHPGHDLPRSILGGTLLISVIYTLFNGALLRVLPVSRLAESPLPPAGAVEMLFGANGGKLAVLLCLLTLPPAFNSAVLCATRIAFAMSRDKLFWANASSVNPRGTPVPAMLLSSLMGVLLSVSGTFEQLLTWVGVLNAATFCAALASLLVLRKREPELARPFRARPYPWITLLALAGGAALLAAAGAGDPKSTFQALGLALAGYPVYRFSRRLRGSADQRG